MTTLFHVKAIAHGLLRRLVFVLLFGPRLLEPDVIDLTRRPKHVKGAPRPVEPGRAVRQLLARAIRAERHEIRGARIVRQYRDPVVDRRERRVAQMDAAKANLPQINWGELRSVR